MEFKSIAATQTWWAGIIARSLPAIALFVSACSSAPKHEIASSEIVPDAVVARIDDLKARPDWVSESQPFKIKDGTVTSIGITTAPADGTRVEALTRIAQNSGKAAIAAAVESRLEFIFQNAEEGVSFDSTQARYIGSEASKIVTSSIRSGPVYWEKIATSSDGGERKTVYKVFAAVNMPESELKKAILEAARKRDGKSGLSANFSKKVDEQWDRFASGE
ncbi:MAG: hypothetical protein AB7F86_01335 [Bdellovibrionales bacterium]